MDHRVERLRTPAECASFARNAVAKNRPDLALEANRKSVNLNVATHEALTPLEADGFAAVYAMAIWATPVERWQGPAQKIFYIHAPAAWGALLAFSIVGLASIGYLWLRDPRLDLFAESSAEVGLVFGLMYFRGSNRYSIFILAIALFFLVSRMSRLVRGWNRAAPSCVPRARRRAVGHRLSGNEGRAMLPGSAATRRCLQFGPQGRDSDDRARRSSVQDCQSGCRWRAAGGPRGLLVGRRRHAAAAEPSDRDARSKLRLFHAHRLGERQ